MLPPTGGQAWPHGDDVAGMSEQGGQGAVCLSGWRTFQRVKGTKARPYNGGVPAAFEGGPRG